MKSKGVVNWRGGTEGEIGVAVDMEPWREEQETGEGRTGGGVA